MKTLSTIIGVVVLGLFSFITITLLNGAVMVQLWNWFMVAIFHLPSLSIAAAIGIQSTLALLLGYNTTNPQKLESDAQGNVRLVKTGAIEAIALSYAKPIMFLLTGWVVLQFMPH